MRTLRTSAIFWAMAIGACGGAARGPHTEAPAHSCAGRPFSDRSPWNQRIDERAELHPENAQLIAQVEHKGNAFGLNLRPWGVPVFSANATTPRFPVRVTDLAGFGFSDSALIPIPTEVRADPEFDGHVAIVSESMCFAWDCWQFRYEDNSPVCTVAAGIELDGEGVHPGFDVATGNEAHGARACGYPLVAGLVRVAEFDRGTIDHALVFAYPGIRAIDFVFPASTGHPLFPQISREEGLPCGAHIRLDPNLDLDALALSPFARMVAEALQRYGAYIGDYSGSLSFYAESSPAAMNAWQTRGVDVHALETIPVNRLQVLAWENLRTGR